MALSVSDDEDDGSYEVSATTDHGPAQKRRKTTKANKTRGSVADILGMKEVTGRSIAYVCVQVRPDISYLKLGANVTAGTFRTH